MLDLPLKVHSEACSVMMQSEQERSVAMQGSSRFEG